MLKVLAICRFATCASDIGEANQWPGIGRLMQYGWPLNKVSKVGYDTIKPENHFGATLLVQNPLQDHSFLRSVVAAPFAGCYRRLGQRRQLSLAAVEYAKG
jgi:hypothetical protein